MKAADLFRRKQHNNSLSVFDTVSEIRSDSGLRLSARRALLYDILIELVISFLSGYSFVHVFTSAFDLTVREYYFLPAVLILSVIVLLIARDKKIGVILFIGAITAAVVFSIARLEELVAECTGIYDRLIQAFDEAYRTETDIHYAIAPHSDVTFIMMIFSILPVWQTGYSYGRNIPPFIATVFLLIPPVLAAVCLKAPGLLPVSVLLFCILLQFFLCRSECLSETHDMARSMQLKLRFAISVFTAALIVALVVFSAYLVYPLIKKPFRAAAKAYASSSISDLLAKIEGNPFDISKPGMSEGDFSNVGEVVRNNKAILSVSFEMDSPHETYLRGFAGGRYTGKAWEKLRNSVPASQMPDEIHFTDVYFGRVDKDDAFFRNPFLYYQALYAGALAHDADEINMITIREEDDRDRYVYLPYGIRGASSEQLRGASFTGDLYAVTDRTQRTVFTTAGIGTLHDAIVKASGRQYLEGVLQPDGTPLSGYETADYMRQLLSERYGISLSEEELKQNLYTEYVFTDSQHREIHIRQKEACLSEYEDWVLSSNLESGASKRVQDLAAEIAMD
ncbi:MAG: DUF3488 domain-containing protein, partial [Lachnospiraceae bacterium]|nr:DUF3488 domain-containing protein [Lachnospiraceae bacterium]